MTEANAAALWKNASGAIICTSRSIPTPSTGALPLPRGVFYCPCASHAHAAFSTTRWWKEKGTTIKRVQSFSFVDLNSLRLPFHQISEKWPQKIADLMYNNNAALCDGCIHPEKRHLLIYDFLAIRTHTYLLRPQLAVSKLKIINKKLQQRFSRLCAAKLLE